MLQVNIGTITRLEFESYMQTWLNSFGHHTGSFAGCVVVTLLTDLIVNEKRTAKRYVLG